MKKIKNLSIMDIGDVSEHSGLPASTLRYYEEKGLIRSTGRSGLRRLFSSKVLVQLELIALGRHAGFSLDEMRKMFQLDGRLQIDRNLLSAKAVELNRDIKKLTAISNLLQHVAACSAPSHMECPKFQRLLHFAGKLETKTRNKSQIKRNKRQNI